MRRGVCIYLSKDKNSLCPPPCNLLSGCHGSNKDGEYLVGTVNENLPLLYFCVCSTPVHLSLLLAAKLFCFASESFTALEDFPPVSFGRWRFSRVRWILPPSLLFSNLSSAQIRSRGLQSVFGVGAFPVLE